MEISEGPAFQLLGEWQAHQTAIVCDCQAGQGASFSCGGAELVSFEHQLHVKTSKSSIQADMRDASIELSSSGR
jgi:hypothetical protein